MLVLIDRGDYFQTGFIIRKGSFPHIQEAGLSAFQDNIVQLAPHLRESVRELRDWKEVQLLSVQINRLTQWHRPGLLIIGDAAHAMSPAGGVGINLAIQDAVAAARILAEPLKTGQVTETTLAAVQRRREFPTRFTQFVQRIIHNVLAAAFRNPIAVTAPTWFRLLTDSGIAPHVTARAIGMGARPEHIVKTKPAVRRKLLAGAAGIGAAIGALAILTRERPEVTEPRPS